MAASMLVIATFAVGSMVSAYSSASNTATPRSFPLIVADDVSQTALSSFIGAFIFSIVTLIAVKNGYYQEAGHFAVFVLTLAVFAWVVFTFLRWVDNIARLGRLSSVIDKVEAAAGDAIDRRARRPLMNGVSVGENAPPVAVHSDQAGYVRRIDMDTLQALAERTQSNILVTALPGTFASPSQPLARVTRVDSDPEAFAAEVANAFKVGGERVFDDDPRFGVICLAEIASRALSPAINDAGTAIDILGTMVRVFTRWERQREPAEETLYDRVQVPLISVDDLFDDAFTAIARDGGSVIEVQVRLQKALLALHEIGSADARRAAMRHSRQALARANALLVLDAEKKALAEVAAWSDR